MNIEHIAAFTDGESGGNPAGVVLCDALPEAAIMQRVAAEVGYSETAFAAPHGEGWRVRYFAPEMEVPFCGHATIALGAALARAKGDGVFALTLNDSGITVEGHSEGALVAAALQSPPTRSEPADKRLVEAALDLFSYSDIDLDPRIPPAIAFAGATHLILTLAARAQLGAMDYDLDEGRALMNKAGLVTIMLVTIESNQLFHARNAFASGGLHEDPATGAAAAAFAGYLRDIGWAHGGAIRIIQGEDIGMGCILNAAIPPGRGESIRVSGTARWMVGDQS